MKKIHCYLVRNTSSCEGTYLYQDEYRTLAPRQLVELTQKPVSVTQNIVVSEYYKEVSEETKIENKPASQTSEARKEK
jgi:hypothetical protein